MSPSETYQRRLHEIAEELDGEESKSNRLSNLRLGAFLLSFCFGTFGTVASVGQPIVLACFLFAAIALVVFIYLVMRHRRVSARIVRLRHLRKLNESAISRLDRRWSDFPVPHAPAEFAENMTAHDLDLFGEASVFQLVCSHFSPQGRYLLAKWLVTPADPDEIRLRQESVVALSEKLEWRQELSANGMELSEDEAVIVPEWIEVDPWFYGSTRLRNYVRWSPLVFLASFLLFFLFFPLPVFLLVLGVHGFLAQKKYRTKIDESLGDLPEIDRRLRHYSEAFAFVETCELENGRLQELRNSIGEATSAMSQLEHIATKAAIKGSILHPLMNGIMLWDLAVVGDLEKWHERYSEKFSGWFKALGEFEALCSLAGLHFDEPEWVFPDFETERKIRSEALAHPLIPADQRVGNSPTVGPEGRFLLVTGSNMSGKSTLLRSLGVNIVLAQAGAPVCADLFSLPPVALATSMRASDSLSDGVSFFMAELNRIRDVVLMAGEHRDTDRMVIFLLDEILQGTNTVERREIVQRVVAHLLECGATGAITTHDLALAEMEGLSEKSDLVHFRESFSRDEDGKPSMTFDYRMREGLATTTNALKILEVIEMPV